MQSMSSIKFRWLTSLPLILAMLILLFIAINALIGATSPNAPVREALFDYYQRINPAPPTASSPFHLVTIDKESVDKVGPWPWPRTVMAELIDASVASGAKAVLIAEPLDRPDLLSPETIGDFWLKGAQDETLAAELQLLPRTNEVLAQSLNALPAGTGFSDKTYSILSDVNFTRADTALSNGLIKTKTDNGSEFIALPRAIPRDKLSPALVAASTPVVLNLPTDNNSYLRRSYLYWANDAKPSPALALEAARLAIGTNSVTLDTLNATTSDQGRIPGKLVIGSQSLDLEGQGTLRLYPPRRSAITKTTSWKLLDGSASRQPLLGKVILIGRDSSITDGIRSAHGRMSPLEAHAMIADQITNGVSLKRPGFFGYIEAIAVMILGAAAIMLAQRLVFWQAIAAAILGALLLLIISTILFFSNGWLFNPILPGVTMFLGALSIAGGKSVGTILFDDNVRGAFRGMLPEAAMKALREDRTGKVLSGVQRKTTVLACELRITDDDLQSISDTPHTVSQILSAASHHLRQTITKIGGTVDQADGGRLFAYFNVPLETSDHIEKACAAALALIESMDKTNSELAASSQTGTIQVHLAIGIASGTCFTGPMGYGRNNRYSAIGDAVDMASFLRRKSEYYGPAIICTDMVYRESHHKYAFLELDSVDIPYKDRTENIHALIGNPFIKSSKSFRELDVPHRSMIAAFRAGNAAEARENLDKVKKLPAANIALFEIYEERIKSLEAQGTSDELEEATAS